MNITVIAEHSVCLDLIPAGADIMDIGCRGFEFTDYFRDLGHTVYPVDIDDLGKEKPYYRFAISDEGGRCAVQRTNDPQATSIKEGDEIDKITIRGFRRRKSIPFFHLIKMDIEGEEVNVLRNAPQHPLANQVSVEFHAHCRPEQTKESLDNLLTYLEQYYTIHNKVWESRHGAGFNYWDVLLIAK